MRMSYAWVILSIVLAIDHAMGFNCPAHNKLKKYNLDKVLHVKEERSTPPSKTTQEWYINACDSEGGMPAECHSDDLLCGLMWSTLPDKEPILTRELHVKQDKIERIDSSPGRFSLSFKSLAYGDEFIRPYISFQCDLDSEKNQLSNPHWGGSFGFVVIKGPAGCVKKEYDHGGANIPHVVRRHSGPSWFTWLLIYAVLFTVTYLVVVSYLSTRGGSIQDFRDELVDRFKTFVTSLVSFVKEILSKVFNKTPSKRGGYSAV